MNHFRTESHFQKAVQNPQDVTGNTVNIGDKNAHFCEVPSNSAEYAQSEWESMGVIGLEINHVTSCNTTPLQTSKNSGGAPSGARTENPSPRVQYVLNLIEKLTPEEKKMLLHHLCRKIPDNS